MPPECVLLFGCELDLKLHGVVIGIGKYLVQGLDGDELNVWREDETVDNVVLCVLRIRRIVRLIEQPARRRFEVIRKRPALGHDIVGYGARLPVFLVRVGVLFKSVGNI